MALVEVKPATLTEIIAGHAKVEILAQPIEWTNDTLAMRWGTYRSSLILIVSK